MNQPIDFENRLTDLLRRRGQKADLRFSADDVRRRASAPTPEPRFDQGPTARPGRIWPPLAAAAVVLVVCGGAFVALRDSSVQVDTGPAPNGAGSDFEEPTSDRVVLTIEPSRGEPMKLGDDAVVLLADSIGIVEFGSPPPALVLEQPWLARARCVAAAEGLACAVADGTTAPDDLVSNDSTYAESARAGPSFLVVGGSGEPFVFAMEGGAAIVGQLPDSAVRVDADVGPAAYRQTPMAGVAAFPLADSTTEFQIRAYDDRDRLVWDSLAFELPQPDSTADRDAIVLDTLDGLPEGTRVEPSPALLARISGGLRSVTPSGDRTTIELDTDLIRFIEQPAADVHAFLVPYRDLTGICIFVEDASGGTVDACTDADDFVARGIWLTEDNIERSYTVAVHPEQPN